MPKVVLLVLSLYSTCPQLDCDLNSLTGASSMWSGFSYPQQPHTAAQTATDEASADSGQSPSASDVLYDRDMPPSGDSELQQNSSIQATSADGPATAQTIAQQPAHASPFAHWSSTPLLGPLSQSQPRWSPSNRSQHAQQAAAAQQLFESQQQPQHAQQVRLFDVPQLRDLNQDPQQAQQAGQICSPSSRGRSTEQGSPQCPHKPGSGLQFGSPILQQPPLQAPDAAAADGGTAEEGPVQDDREAGSEQDSTVVNTLLLTFAPTASQDLADSERQARESELSPSSSRGHTQPPGLIVG